MLLKEDNWGGKENVEVSLLAFWVWERGTGADVTGQKSGRGFGGGGREVSNLGGEGQSAHSGGSGRPGFGDF